MNSDVLARPTFWYHPESESPWINLGQSRLGPIDDGTSQQISEYQYVKAIIKAIDEDPEHKLPEGIDGIIKLGELRPDGTLDGQLWYSKTVPSSTMISTSKHVKREPGNIFTTSGGRKYIVELVHQKDDIDRG